MITASQAVGIALLLAAASGPLLAAEEQAACRADPLSGRTLYLRGTFNTWAAADAQKFTWACTRFEAVTRISGEHKFKVGDEAWSADADFGRGADDFGPLVARGAEFTRRFEPGVYRFTLTPPTPSGEAGASSGPLLKVDACAAGAPFGDTVLYLRGAVNNWAALDDFAFQYRCDAYYLNLNLNLKASGRQEFKIADAGWRAETTLGRGEGSAAVAVGGNFAHHFTGEHTARLSFVDGRAALTIGPKTFADPNARSVTDPVALSLVFDSRALAHKTVFGAITPGRVIDFHLGAMPGVEQLTLVVERRRFEGNQEVLEYTEVARLPMQKAAGADGHERWSTSHRFSDISVYGYWFEARIGDRSFVYQNNNDPVFWTREKGSGGLGQVADLPASLKLIRRFRQTVFAADFKVPDWAPDIVYYQIFPDRFRNGDKTNDPKPGVDRYQKYGIEMHSQWLERPFKPGSGDGSDAVYNNDFFGGDLAGIINKLDYIKELGANTLYLTPIFKAPSNHKYDTADYRRVDPAFGSNADFQRLTKEAARRGMRVIPDTSLNHTGADSVYFDRYGNHARASGSKGADQGAFEGGRVRPNSPYASWYRFDTSQTDPDKQYKGWGGPDLPELDKASPAWRKFAYGERNAVTQVWLDRGAAGWRMDVAPWVADDFWREWRAAVKAHKPDALTVAETWFDASKYFLGDMFDSTMNYILRNTVLEYAAGGKANALYRNIELMREAYPPQAFYALMNLISSHDQARALHHLGWLDDTRDPAVIALAKQRLRLAVFFQMTFPGAPTIYYGDEVGVSGGEDPYNRAPYPWADLGGKPDNNLLREFKKLTQLRRDHAVLRRGSIDAPAYIDDQVIVLVRRLGAGSAVVAMNNAATPKTVTVMLPEGMNAASLKDAFSGAVLRITDGSVTITVPALYGTVLLGR